MAVRNVHFFEAVFTVIVGVFLYLTYFAIVSFNYNLFTTSPRLGPFCCFLIMGYFTVPSVVLIAASIGVWRDSIGWKLLVWMASSGVLLGMEAVAVLGKAIVYQDWSIKTSFGVWIVYLAVMHILVNAYRHLLCKEVRIP
jgi:RsiW-degrading membrane proteinase PrsW (M82 family)